MKESEHLIENTKKAGKYCKKDYTEEQVEEILSKMKHTVDLYLSENIGEPLLGMWKDENKLFLIISGLSQLPEFETKKGILNLFRNLQSKDFCHSEEDRECPEDELFCFKIDVDYTEKGKLYEHQLDRLKVSTLKELYLKFKFKYTPECTLFTMSYHFPTKGKKEWDKLF